MVCCIIYLAYYVQPAVRIPIPQTETKIVQYITEYNSVGKWILYMKWITYVYSEPHLHH